jgi:lysophospholipase L1-like esterase
LVLATIPCVPSYSNYYKNEIVRAAGNRYIDFAKAVDGEAVGSTWYAGMLYTDNVHPTALGAKALASRFVQDFPDTIQE